MRIPISIVGGESTLFYGGLSVSVQYPLVGDDAHGGNSDKDSHGDDKTAQL